MKKYKYLIIISILVWWLTAYFLACPSPTPSYDVVFTQPTNYIYGNYILTGKIKAEQRFLWDIYTKGLMVEKLSLSGNIVARLGYGKDNSGDEQKTIPVNPIYNTVVNLTPDSVFNVLIVNTSNEDYKFNIIVILK